MAVVHAGGCSAAESLLVRCRASPVRLRPKLDRSLTIHSCATCSCPQRDAYWYRHCRAEYDVVLHAPSRDVVDTIIAYIVYE
jgi:hypothetical protein